MSTLAFVEMIACQFLGSNFVRSAARSQSEAKAALKAADPRLSASRQAGFA